MSFLYYEVFDCCYCTDSEVTGTHTIRHVIQTLWLCQKADDSNNSTLIHKSPLYNHQVYSVVVPPLYALSPAGTQVE